MIIALADLLEAEGRALRRSALRTAVAVACVGTVVVLAWVGLAFFAWAGYQYLLVRSGPATASLICGLVLIFFAGVLAWRMKRLLS